MSNVYRKAERRDKVVKEVLEESSFRGWFARLVAGALALFLFWR